jgi:transcriptional regulator with XRE-family HTH domain
MPDINDVVSRNIRKARQAQGLSQEALAFKSKLHRAYIGQVERGEKKIGLTNLQKIADALKLDIAVFLHEKAE